MLAGGAKWFKGLSANERGRPSNEVFVYFMYDSKDNFYNEWNLLEDVPIKQARSYHSSCNLKRTVYLFGGYD